MMLVAGKGRASYLAITAGSNGDCPVTPGSTALREDWDGPLSADGAKADADARAERHTMLVNFIISVN